MKRTNLMTQRVVNRQAEWKARLDRLLTRSVGVGACSAMILVAAAAPSVLADEDIYRYVSSNGTIYMTNVPSDRKFVPVTGKRMYHASVSDQELEDATARYALEYRLSPALLMAVMKGESDFNPTVIAKAGAVGLMQLIPETAIRHGVRNLYDTRERILPVGPSTSGISSIDFTATFDLPWLRTMRESERLTDIVRFLPSKKREPT